MRARPGGQEGVYCGCTSKELGHDGSGCTCLQHAGPARSLRGQRGVPESQSPEDRYHPRDYLEPHLHGMDAKLQVENCLLCHGDDLTGGTSERSCDPCHESEWRTTCTFCHGGQETDDGAPPRDIRGATAENDLSFPPHTKHVTTTLREPLDCESCHASPPEDVLSPGHVLVGDSTPGVAEVDLSEGLSSPAR